MLHLVAQTADKPFSPLVRAPADKDGPGTRQNGGPRGHSRDAAAFSPVVFEHLFGLTLGGVAC
ncbi:hypothetical protein MAE02_12550 [Microvirga aerophila]|uniref:Uncharacterized protein n=1 Tax=Microvirga aerophila TaxID=670291 RepID=A0A512BNM6_9HYPH|nr:hypothetical protein MAE02_12550 [Microvirga aerophila]